MKIKLTSNLISKTENSQHLEVNHLFKSLLAFWLERKWMKLNESSFFSAQGLFTKWFCDYKILCFHFQIQKFWRAMEFHGWMNEFILKYVFLTFRYFLDNVFKTIYSQDIDIYVIFFSHFFHFHLQNQKTWNAMEFQPLMEFHKIQNFGRLV